MIASIQPTFYSKVISETDITGRLPERCSFPVSYAKAREIVVEEGCIVVQNYSNYLFFIEVYEMDLTKDLRASYVVREHSFYLFLMFEGKLRLSAPDGSDINHADKGVFYANYKKQGAQIINSIPAGTHKFCYIVPRMEWLERKASEFPAIEGFIKSFRNGSNSFGYMPRCFIDTKIYKEVLKLCRLETSNGLDTEAQILNHAIRILRLYNDMIISGAVIRSDTHSDRIKLVKRYIEENCKDLQIGDMQKLADKFFFTRRTLTRVFKNETGCTVHQYIEKSKLDNAFKLLKATKLSIKDVSRLAGYPDQNYFSRVFRKQFGYSPRNIR